MDDYFAKLFAGHMGISAVLANALVDKGVISIEELSGRFQQAHRAAAQCSSGPATAHALAEIIAYLDRQRSRPARPATAGRWTPRFSAEARLLDAIDRRLEALLGAPRAASRHQAHGRPAGNLRALRRRRHQPLHALSKSRRDAQSEHQRHRATPSAGGLGARLQATRTGRVSAPRFARRQPAAAAPAVLKGNEVQRHRELPSSL